MMISGNLELVFKEEKVYNMIGMAVMGHGRIYLFQYVVFISVHRI